MGFQFPTSLSKAERPLGPLLTSSPPSAPARIGLHGRTCELQPLNGPHHDDLFRTLNKDELWDYMLNEPFEDFEAFSSHYRKLIENKETSTIYYVVLTKPDLQPEGLIALMEVNTTHRSLEIGHVIFSPRLQKTTAATEAVYLALNYSFMLGFTRVVWKCNNLNEKSKKAAGRFGFDYEGVHKRHMVVKGRVRDTAWYAVTADTWPRVKTGFEKWLRVDNFDKDGRQRKTLQEAIWISGLSVQKTFKYKVAIA